MRFRMQLTMITVFAVLIAALPALASVVKMTIPDGTEIRLILEERLSSDTAELDQKIHFKVAQDVFVRGRRIITAGAQAWGFVTEVKKKGVFGKNGKLDFTIDFVEAVDGQNIRLHGMKRRSGDNHYTKAGIIAYATGGVGGLFVKGKNAEIPPGAEYLIYIDGDRHIEINFDAGMAEAGR